HPDTATRIAAIELVGCYSAELSRKELLNLFTPELPEPFLIAVMRALADDPGSGLERKLIELWTGFTPDAKRIALEIMLSREYRMIVWFQAAIEGSVSAAEADSLQREMLKHHKNPQIKSLADQAFQSIASSSRQAVIAEYQPVLQMKGHIDDGAKVFEK